MQNLSPFIKAVPNFPKPGITFLDISPLFRNHFDELVNQMADLIEELDDTDFDFVAGIEARGFAIGAAVAYRLGKGFIPIRKKGKLPPVVERITYDLEYGQDALEMHHGSGRILLIDDVLATGGTFRAAAELCERTGHTLVALACIVDLKFLNSFSYNGLTAKALLTFNEL
jgi:adenine phosphoribosyltransferase